MTSELYAKLLHALKTGTSLADAYVIESRRATDRFFFVNMFIHEDNQLERVVWTHRLAKAYMFATEQAVEEFKAQYVSPRKVSIVRVQPYAFVNTL